MNELRSDATLRYNRTRLLELRGNFDIKNSLKTVLNEAGLLINKEKPRKKLRRGTKGRRKPKPTTCSQRATLTAPGDPRVITSNHDGHQHQRSTTTTNQPRYEHPSIFYTNARSLNINKKADLEHYAISLKPDIIAVTETWLTNRNEDNGEINKYNMFTAHRCNSRIGGGVCLYVADTINATKIDSMVSKTNSAVWVRIAKPKQPSTVIGCLYHPKSRRAEDSVITIDYLITTLAKLTSRYKNSRVILCGDFNHLNMEATCEAFKLRKLVDFATRQGAHLDNIYSDIVEYNKQTVQNLPPLIGNEEDHCCLYLPSCFKKKHEYKYKTKRLYKHDTKAKLAEQLYNHDWSDLYGEPDVHKKAALFQTSMRKIVDNTCPTRRVRVRDDDPAWESDLTCKIRRARNRARQKKSKSYKYLSNVLKQLIAKNRKRTIDKTINDLDNNDGKWWSRVAKLLGREKATPEMNSIDGVWCDSHQLAQKLNQHFLNVGGHCEEFEMPNASELPLRQAVSVSIGR